MVKEKIIMRIGTNMSFIKKCLLICVLFALQFKTTAQTTSAKIESLIAKMSIEEKVGQMTNIAIGMVATETPDAVLLNEEKLRNVIIKNKVGSLQNVNSHAYTLEQWHKLINGVQKINMDESRLKIPLLYAIDAVHGANYTIGSTLFPHNLGLAAARNTLLAKQSAQITAKEIRASGIRYNFSPVAGAPIAGKEKRISR